MENWSSEPKEQKKFAGFVLDSKDASLSNISHMRVSPQEETLEGVWLVAEECLRFWYPILENKDQVERPRRIFDLAVKDGYDLAGRMW